MKRNVPRVHSPIVAPTLVHATANHEPKNIDRKPRRSSTAALAAGAAGFAAAAVAAGFGAAATGAGTGAGAGAVGVVCVSAGLMPSAGLSGVGFCSDMSPKLHGENEPPRGRSLEIRCR